jgi:hypothetical protein
LFTLCDCRCSLFPTFIFNFSEYHKQRLKLLVPLLNELNPQYYLFTIQQILFNCGEICEQILNIQLTLADTITTQSNDSDPKQIKTWTNKCNKMFVLFFVFFFENLISTFVNFFIFLGVFTVFHIFKNFFKPSLPKIQKNLELLKKNI